MGLLNMLAVEAGCEYLSDLRLLQRPNAEIRRAVENTPLSDFSAYEWIKTAEYLCGERYKSADDARKAILHF